jgi:hypothetical protein
LDRLLELVDFLLEFCGGFYNAFSDEIAQADASASISIATSSVFSFSSISIAAFFRRWMVAISVLRFSMVVHAVKKRL